MVKFYTQYWWVFVVRGVLAILLGIFALTWPLQTVAALVLAFGAVALIDGIFSIATAFAGRKLTEDWWVLLVQGLFGMLVGIVTVLNPAATAVVLLIAIAVWAIGLGLLQIVAAVRLRHEISGEWWLAIGGVAGIAFGLLLMRNPAGGALAVLWLIGTYAVVWGVMLAIGGFEMLWLRKHATA